MWSLVTKWPFYLRVYALCSCQRNGIDHVDLHQFVNLLDWKEHPLPKSKEKKVKSALRYPVPSDFRDDLMTVFVV